MESRHTAVIVNPASAGGATADRLGELEELLRATLGEYTMMVSPGRGEARGLARVALLEGYDLIVAVGGDGTIHEVVNGFFQEDRPLNPKAVLAVVPQGTGSDFARSLGIPRDETALHLIVEGRTKMVDVGRVRLHDEAGQAQDRLFINVAHFGLGGTVGRKVNESRKPIGGFIPYLLGLLRSIRGYRPPLMKIQAEEQSLHRRCLNVFVANGRFLGGGMEIAPQARLDSGRFEIGIAGDLPRLSALRAVARLYLRRQRETPGVIEFSATELMASADRPVRVNLDGEDAGLLPAKFQILPAAIEVVVGRDEEPGTQGA